MAYSDYVHHVDARVRPDIVDPARVAPVALLDESNARWNASGRFVDVRRHGDDGVEIVFQLRSDEFPYDRFTDDLSDPDIATTAQRIAVFFNEDE